MTWRRAAAWAVAIAAVAGSAAAPGADTPAAGFARLSAVDPAIVQDMRYAGADNFTGAPVPGYEAATCLVTHEAAAALSRAAAALRTRGFGMIVWDCYRPAQAVAAFVAWAKSGDERMKQAYFPRVPKSELFARGYIASRSRHSAGSTVDVGLTLLDLTQPPVRDADRPLVDCAAPFGERPDDGTVDMGTAYDCFDELANGDAAVNEEARRHRDILKDAMIAAGFAPYAEEWWHFTLRDEPYPGAAFDTPVR